MKASPGDRIGAVLGGRWELVELLGRGGQSTVYRARDQQGGEDVAVKVLLPNTDPQSVERMVREASAMSQLAGTTAAVRVFDQVSEEDGTRALVIELLHRWDLLHYLEHREARGQHMSINSIIALAEPLVETLEAAHAIGIVHRDIKPPNIWIMHESHGGGVRLLDFGFAKLARAVAITDSDQVAGTPTFIAPEVFLQGAAKADPRADVYSLAVVFFRILAGRVPFEGDSLLDLLKKVTAGPRPSLHAIRPDLPPSVDEWVEQALAANRDLRFARVRAMWNALLVCLEDR